MFQITIWEKVLNLSSAATPYQSRNTDMCHTFLAAGPAGLAFLASGLGSGSLKSSMGLWFLAGAVK